MANASTASGATGLDWENESWNSPTDKEWSRAVRGLALKVFQHVSGYEGEPSKAGGNPGSLEERLVAAHQFVSRAKRTRS